MAKQEQSVGRSTASGVAGFFKGLVSGAISGGVIVAALATVAALAGWAIGGSTGVVEAVKGLTSFTTTSGGGAIGSAVTTTTTNLLPFTIGGIGTAIGGAALAGATVGAATFGTLGSGIGTIVGVANSRNVSTENPQLQALKEQQIAQTNLAQGMVNGALLTQMDSLNRQQQELKKKQVEAPAPALDFGGGGDFGGMAQNNWTARPDIAARAPKEGIKLFAEAEADKKVAAAQAGVAVGPA